MESDLHQFHQRQDQIEQKPMTSGLTRYQSAPSSYFSSYMEKDFADDFLNRPSSPETERIFARFLASCGGDDTSENKLSNNNNFNNNDMNRTNNNVGMMNQSSTGGGIKMEVDTQPSLQQQVNLPPLSNNTPGVLQRQQENYSSASQEFYRQNLQNQNPTSAVDYKAMGSGGFDRFAQMRTTASGAGGSSSNLIRHSSSPAGLFSDIRIENGIFTFSFLLCFLYLKTLFAL